jgi:hypothetical protein
VLLVRTNCPGREEVAFTRGGGIVTVRAGDRVVVVLRDRGNGKGPDRLHTHCAATGLFKHSDALQELVELLISEE